MMDQRIYDNNVRAIKDRWPELLEIFVDQKPDNGLCCEIVDVEGMFIPVIKREGRAYQLTSLCSDEAILDRWIRFVNSNLYDSVVYFFGFGTGMYVRKLLDNNDESRQKSIAVLVYEPDPSILSELIRYYDYTDIISDERVTLVVGEKGFKEIRQWTRKHVNHKNIRGSGSAYYLNYPRIFPEEKKEYDKEIEELLSNYYSNIGFRKWRSETVYSNSLKSIPVIAGSWSLDSLENVLPDNVPVFIVSSGPSLSKNVHELKRAKGRGFIIAADSSLGVFDNAEIIPDLFVTVDPVKQRENYSFDWLPKVPVMLDMGSPEYVIKEGQPYFMLCSYDEYTAFYINKLKGAISCHTVLTGGGSVAHHAFSLAMMMGAKTIVFVGQDLAYTDDKAHAAEVAIDDDSMIDSVETIDVNGNPIRSSRELVFYKRWFEEIIEKTKGRVFIDATEGGALIKGTRIMPLKEAIDQYCVKEWEAKKTLSECKKLFSEEQKKLYFDAIKKVPERTDEIIKDSRNLITDYEKIAKGVRSGRVTGTKLRKLLADCRVLSDKIEENEAYSYIDMLISDSEINLEKTVNNVDPDTTRDILNMCTLGGEHAENIIKAAEKVKKDFVGLGELK